VLAKPLHGTVPSVVGQSWKRASPKLQRLKLRVTVESGRGKRGRVLAQSPRGGVAAAPGMRVTVTVGTSG
jgi:beta-lactam-binding protein with PASTA domain